MKLPADSVRGRIRNYLEKNAHLLGRRVLEVGSLLPAAHADWANNRTICEHDVWVGTDIQAGLNVDRVVAAEQLDYRNEFTGAVSSEMLEHVEFPFSVLRHLHNALIDGGWLLVTTLTCFPIHGYPDDYWRFTPHCLKMLMQSAGFKDVEVESAGEVQFALNDHGEDGLTHLTCPMHVFARGRK